jgi:hypothetical protein
VAAAIELQRAHVKASWPRDLEVRVRLGLHTGEPAIGDEGYTGLDVVRASRIAAVGAGGQVLLSDTTRAIVAGDLGDGVSLRSLGDRQLKDIDRPEPLFELVIDEVEEAAPATQPEPEAEPGPDQDSARSGPMRDFAERTRQTIESRVLAQLEKSLGSGFPFGPPTPSKPPKKSVTQEIARLHELREDGALTDEQYQRAVDRLLGQDDLPKG